MFLLKPGRPNNRRLRLFKAGRAMADSGRASGVIPARFSTWLIARAAATSPQNGEVSDGPR